MKHFVDNGTLALTGQLPFLLLLAAALAWAVSLGLLSLYRRAVLRSMRTRVNVGATPLTVSAPSPSPVSTMPTFAFLTSSSAMPVVSAARTLYATISRAPWWTAAIYAIAGSAYAVVMAATFLMSSKIVGSPLRFLVLFWLYVWPVVPATNIILMPRRRTQLGVTGVYFLLFAALGTLALAGSKTLSWGQVAVLWLVVNLLPTLLLLTFLSRRVRAVGPLVLSFMLLALTGSNVALTIAWSNGSVLSALNTIGYALGLSALGTILLLIAVGFAVFSLIGWLMLRMIRIRYERKQLTDQSLTLDAMWLLFAIVHPIGFVFNGAAWMLSGLLAFTMYKIVVKAGFLLSARKGKALRYCATLLLLRVFSLGRRSEQLFGALATYWRYGGSIRFIAGPDLATATVEPHEFLDFVNGKLGRRFIDGEPGLKQRLAEEERAPDYDGRFRVNDFFCRDDTWQMVLSHLVKESNVVLMDLRGFAPQNAGCIYEINELINVAPLTRIVFVMDETTDEPFLRHTVQQAWNLMGPASPNQSTSPGPLLLFRYTETHASDRHRLLRTLCAAATIALPTTEVQEG